jgi:hypothetical protein
MVLQQFVQNAHLGGTAILWLRVVWIALEEDFQPSKAKQIHVFLALLELFQSHLENHFVWHV